jgi:flagellar hook protein FlgE
MSLISSLSTGQTGLDANSNDLSVIGDNIANSNTVGFKASRAVFADAMAQEMIGSAGASPQTGLGVNTQTVQKLLTQGALSNTGLATDVALDGNGMFVVKGTANGRDGEYYTRNGQFSVDKSGFLVNQEGLRVQGYTASAAGVIQGVPGDLQLNSASSVPSPTTTVTVKANLNSQDVVPTVTPFDPLNPTATSNFSTSTTIYDSLGAAHQVDLYFVKTSATQWAYHALTDGGGLTGGTAGTATEIQTGTLTFDAQGRYTTAPTPTGTFNPINATNPQALTFNFGDPTGGTPAGTGLLGVTSFAQKSNASSVSQDGYASGTLNSMTIDRDGKITGAFSNGQSRVIGQLGIAQFGAPDQMARVSGNLFATTAGSGPATIGGANTGGRGAIVAGALENSNVNLSDELVHMIAAQRNYQANAKTVTTADSLLGELMNLKR